jgi:hypothetical protein
VIVLGRVSPAPAPACHGKHMGRRRGARGGDESQAPSLLILAGQDHYAAVSDALRELGGLAYRPDGRRPPWPRGNRSRVRERPGSLLCRGLVRLGFAPRVAVGC